MSENRFLRPGLNSDGKDQLEKLEDGSNHNQHKDIITSKVNTEGYSKDQLFKLFGCFIGLQVSYIAWGVVQEQLMTQEYGNGKKFTSASFCVFGNRFFALIIALIMVLYQKYTVTSSTVTTNKEANSDKDKDKSNVLPPFYAYAACAASNSLSSFAQYESLKFVSFPTQVLSKSCKIIPVMIVGMILNKKIYAKIDYYDALLITAGVAMFTLSEKSDKRSGGDDHSDSLFGVLLLCLYLTCDSFTSQWQSRIYKNYNLTQYQMMLGVNIWSIMFTGFTLARSGEGMSSFAFIMSDAKALMHMTILSVTSATGQIFIYYTIKEFGPVVFTIIMTTRQIFSLFVSCLVFAHPLQIGGWLGAVMVFFVIFNKLNRGKGKNFFALKWS
jgi:solute carrier family 35 (adenosine 3'-phospho 5'-phosphosulfate transporter), member B2